MRLFKLCLVLLLLIGGLGAFLYWSAQRPSAHYLSDLRSAVVAPATSAATEPQLLLIRPQLFPLDYQSPAHLRLKLAAALEQARQAGLLPPGSLVALPDHIGTWLIARGEKVEFYQARTRKQVRDWLLLGNPWLAVKVLLLNLDAHRLDEALLRMKSAQMAEDYQTLFAGLARDYRITLLAGSILLPAPRVENGQLRSGTGPLRNLSLVFGADGRILGEAYSEAWPQPALDTEPQRIELAGQLWRVERDGAAGHPQSRLLSPDGQRSEALFLRGKLSWPIGGAPRGMDLIPEDAQGSAPPGSHLLHSGSPPR
ncbi:MAG: hydrolase [Pseudomonas sp.]|uniref:hydrolase n=1 Tax=Pseudomonas sp. TaxID=306 RepID=UPI00339375F6